MDRVVTLTAKLVSGRLRLPRTDLEDAFADWPDGDVVLTIRPEGRARSMVQNAYYWGVCVAMVSEETGYSPEEVHGLAKQMFLPKSGAILDDNGKVVGDRVVGGSTKVLSSGEMTEFIDRFRRWAAETVGVSIPDPGEQP